MTATIDWSALTHAYGPASDIPLLLARARVAPASRDYQDEPWYSLWSALCHQGDVYTGSYAAVPELVAIAEARLGEPLVAIQSLYLAATIDLERVMPEGMRPAPGIPEGLQAAYEDALQRGGLVATRMRPRDLDPDWREALAICTAVFSGAYAEARALDNPPEDGEDAH